MPAPFALNLCGYRDGRANTSDKSDPFSVELGRAMFDVMGVSHAAEAPSAIDKPMSRLLAEDLSSRVESAGSDLGIAAERRLDQFEQFRHLGALAGFTGATPRDVTRAVQRLRRFTGRRIVEPPADVRRLEEHIDGLDQALAQESERLAQLVQDLGEESLLKLDVTASRAQERGSPHLVAGLSLKWSLRTDRAQDCRSQGAKMASLRRGRMPHFAAVTMEPRPFMLGILGGGSGEVDCVYHLDLGSLTQAIEENTRGKPARKRAADGFKRLVGQRRLRDYDELVDYTLTL